MRKSLFSAVLLGAVFLIAFALAAPGWTGDASATAQGRTEKVIYSFQQGSNGFYPLCDLILDSSGNLYGNLTNGGVLGQGITFELVRGLEDTWHERVLYAFTGKDDGAEPTGDLVFDSKGNLYGVTTNGGTSSDCDYNCGVVFELSPQAGNRWAETVLYTFSPTYSGGTVYPQGGLLIDSAGNLYGSTEVGGEEACNDYSGCGTVYELSPQNGQYVQKTLHTFLDSPDGLLPNGNLVMDASGNIYGTTEGGGTGGGSGTVFELSPQQGGGWTETLLYNFGEPNTSLYGPRAGVVFGPGGYLYGTAAGGGNCCGGIFQLSRSGNTWVEKDVYDFSGTDGQTPYARVVFDSKGNIYTTTEFGGREGQECDGVSRCGSVIELKRQPDDSWTLLHLYDFKGVPDAIRPTYGVVIGQDGTLYGSTQNGGANSGCFVRFSCGAIYQIRP